MMEKLNIDNSVNNWIIMKILENNQNSKWFQKLFIAMISDSEPRCYISYRWRDGIP